MTWCTHNDLDINVQVYEHEDGLSVIYAHCTECDTRLGYGTSLLDLIGIAAKKDTSA